MTDALVLFCLFLTVVIFYATVRNTAVLKIRLMAIRKSSSIYDRLPDYDSMVFHPKYLHLWTFSQWVNYIERRI